MKAFFVSLDPEYSEEVRKGCWVGPGVPPLPMKDSPCLASNECFFSSFETTLSGRKEKKREGEHLACGSNCQNKLSGSSSFSNPFLSPFPSHEKRE